LNASYHEYIFFSGRRIARSDVSSGNVYFLFVDHLGSTRSMNQVNGTVCFSSEYYPYGQELNSSSSCSTSYKFTGYERDTETGLDYGFARYYSPRLGRFMSGDPLGGDVSDPQGLNRYSYVRGNPTNSTDSTGLSVDWFSGFDASDPNAMGSPWGSGLLARGRFGSAFSNTVATAAYFNGGNAFCQGFAGNVICPWNYDGFQLLTIGTRRPTAHRV
jgi:RHS repeat-associated protein